MNHSTHGRLKRMPLAPIRNGQYKTSWTNGWEHLDSGKHQAALRDFSLALKTDPSQISGYAWRGHCYMEMKDWKHAIKEYKRCIKINPLAAYGMVRLCLAKSYHAIGQYSLAIGQYEEALRERAWPKEHESRQKAQLYLKLALVYATMAKVSPRNLQTIRKSIKGCYI